MTLFFPIFISDVDQIINEISLLLKRQESTEVQLR